MNVLQGALLGLIQGLGEFLPISSSGHLLLARRNPYSSSDHFLERLDRDAASSGKEQNIDLSDCCICSYSRYIFCSQSSFPFIAWFFCFRQRMVPWSILPDYCFFSVGLRSGFVAPRLIDKRNWFSPGFHYGLFPGNRIDPRCFPQRIHHIWRRTVRSR